MSTLYSGDGADPPTDDPIESPEDLQEIFKRGLKPDSEFGIGIEYERLPIALADGRAVPYATPDGDGDSASVERLLENLVTTGGWEPVREAGRIIALERAGTRLTLEPGSQVELSGRVHRRLDDACRELKAFVNEVDRVASPMGIAFVGVGYQPFTDVSEIGWVPKRRYEIMAPYLAAKGRLAHGMMKGTAGCQINLDFSSEADAMQKLRLALGVSSIVTAICANSPLAGGQPNGFTSMRAHIWMHTDPDRCGLLEFALREGANFSSYVDYAMDVPMLFIVRDGHWVDMKGRTFRDFMASGHDGLSASIADWELHLTTLFPEARIKSWMEVRGSDSGPADMILAQAALWKGLLYDEAARRGAWDLVSRASFSERLAFHRDAARAGLGATLLGTSALELAQELVALAQRGLPEAEAIHLEPIRRVVHVEKKTPAETLLERWAGEWNHDVSRFLEAAAPGTTSLPC